MDPATMFVALMASTAAAVVLLLWTYLLNRHEKSLLYSAVAFALGSVGLMSMTFRTLLPTWLYFEFGVSALIFGTALMWSVARTFNGRTVRLWVPALAPAIWFIACLVPGFIGHFGARMIVSSLIIGSFYALAAFEFARVHDGLRTRTFAVVVLLLQSAFVLIRIPFVILDSAPATPSFADTTWFSLSSLESAVFVQVLSFLMISLTKERVEGQLRDAALTDALTGIGNRRAFFDRMEAALAQGARRAEPVAVILFDLDHFKEVNDRFGHPVGDTVIRTFADAARSRIRAGDFVARLGGEEFAVGLPGASGGDACRIGADISAAFGAAVAAMGIPGLAGSASAGVAEAPTRQATVAGLLTAADRALYDAKSGGRGQVLLGAVPLPLRVQAA